MKEPEKAYCLACGEQVPLEKVDLGIEGEELYRCAYCGAYLGTKKSLEKIAENPASAEIFISAPAPAPESTQQMEDFHSEESSLAGGAIPEVPNASLSARQITTQAEDEVFTPAPTPEPELPKLETIILAEDSELVTRILKEMIIAKKLSKRVISCKNGFEFIIEYLKSRTEQIPIGLIILDVIMPVLNGISSAVAIRAWEKALNLEPVPILYFTSKRCDQTFKRVLQHTRPAMYINKGNIERAVQLEQRIEKVVNQLLKESF